ncbi:hypothetical protein [Atlantibacter hermannii]|uniref:hypothetical protein n=1 Tax=Atlantibacter hermannii TaxID=565 RepID=UPI0028A74E14|nr:hypothetical protein [Atlantibacter hermannii]
MKKIVMAAVLAAIPAGCVVQKEDARSGYLVTVFSTQSTTIAQNRADELCGKHAFFLDQIYSAKRNIRQAGIPFSCDFDYAVIGSTEVINIKNARNQRIHDEETKKYNEGLKAIRDIRRRVAAAEPHNMGIYSDVGPNGEIMTQSFYSGVECNSIAGANGGHSECN